MKRNSIPPHRAEEMSQPGETNEPAKKIVSNGARCSVLGCTHSVYDNKLYQWNLSFHKYPKNRAQRKKWVAASQPSNRSVNLSNRYVCSSHFLPHLVLKKRRPGGRVFLVEGAVPTLLLPKEAPSAFLEFPSHSQLDEDKELLDEDDDQKVELDEDDKIEQDIEMVEFSGSEDVDVEGLTQSGDESMDSLRYYDEDSEKEDVIIRVPSEEADHIDLQDPLSVPKPKLWRNMTEKARRATIGAYFARLAGLLPPRDKISKVSVLIDAVNYLKKITKDYTGRAVEEEILMQKHYLLRKRKARLDKRALALAKRADQLQLADKLKE